VSDPAYPRTSRAGAARPEAPRYQEHRREHLGREIRGRFPIACLSNEITDHAGKVATVEHRERTAVTRGDRREQLAIGSLLIQRHLKH